MTVIVEGSARKATGTTTTPAIGVVAPYLAGDHILAFVVGYGSGLTLANDAISGFTKVTTFGVTGSGSGTWFAKKATADSASESSISATLGGGAQATISTLIVRGADPDWLANLADGGNWKKVTAASASTINIAANAITGTADALMLVGCTMSGSATARCYTDNLVSLLLSTASTQAAHFIGYKQMPTTGYGNPALTAYASAAANMQMAVLLIPAASGAALQPFCQANINEVQWYGTCGQANTAMNPTWGNPAAATIDGQATYTGANVSVTTVSGFTHPETGLVWGGTCRIVLASGGPYITGSNQWVGQKHSVSLDLSGNKIVCLTWYNPNTPVSSVFGPKGYAIKFTDNTGKWAVYRLEPKSECIQNSFKSVFIQIGQAALLDWNNNPTAPDIDWTNIVDVTHLMDRIADQTSSQNYEVANLYVLDPANPATITGGGASYPATPAAISEAYASWSTVRYGYRQATTQVMHIASSRIGDGVKKTYFDAGSMELPPKYLAAVQNRWRVAENTLTFGIKAAASNTIYLRAGSLYSEGRQALVVDAASSLSATYGFAGEAVSGFPAILRPGISYAGMTLQRGGITAYGASAGASTPYTFNVGDAEAITLQPTANGQTFDFSACSFAAAITLVNATAYTGVTFIKPVGATVTDDSGANPAITITEPAATRGLDFTITGGTTARVVKLYDTGTQDVVATLSSPDYLWSEAVAGSRTLDYTVQEAGYLPIRVTGVVVTGALSGGVRPITVQQSEALAYVASSGLTFGTNCFAAPATKKFGLTVASTLQNFYSRMMESWITEATLQNKPFPLVANGPNSFALTDDWEWDLATYPNSISLLSRDGMRYKNAAGTTTAMWAALMSVGVLAGLQVRYQQQDGLGTTNAQSTGNIDQLIQIYGDATHGDYDYTSWLVLKVQEEGYDQAEAVVLDIYPTLDDQLFVVALVPTANGIAAQAGITGVTIYSEPTPVSWNGQLFSTTITDTTDTHSGLQIMQYVRSLNNFNLHDMIRANGAKFKTVTGNVYGDTLTTPAGVRVVMADGTTPHPDFDVFIADSGGSYVPDVVAPITWAGALNGTTVLLYNDSNAGAIIDTQAVSGAGGYTWTISLPHADVAIGDSLRLRFGHKEYFAGELQGTMTASGLAFVGAMTLHPVYAGWALNGATYDQANGGPYTMDGTNLQVDIAAAATTGLKTQLGAWTQYLMTLPAGLDAFFGAWDLLALNQIRQNVGVVDVKIDVPTAGALFTFTDNDVNYYRSDFTFPGNVEAGHGLVAITYNASIFVPAPTIISGESVVTGTPDTVAAAVRTELAAELAATLRAEKFARNKQVLNPATGSRVVYDNDGTTVLGQGDAFMDVAGTQPYDGTGPVHRTERLA